MKDIIIWIILLFVFIIIIGLYTTKSTPIDLNEKEKIMKLNMAIENFTSNMIQKENFTEVSSQSDISSGASRIYRRGLPEDKININTQNCNVPESTFKPSECKPKEDINTNEICSKCDITTNKDINKYVLKASIPPCPDMSEFVTKNMISAHPDINDYILKSEIKPCPNIDLSKYILKSSVPPCPTCPTCPICPICPPQTDCKTINQYKISEHPDYTKYISKNDLEKEYIKKSSLKNIIQNVREQLKKCEMKRHIHYNNQDTNIFTNMYNNIKDFLFGTDHDIYPKNINNNYYYNRYNKDNHRNAYNKNYYNDNHNHGYHEHDNEDNVYYLYDKEDPDNNYYYNIYHINDDKNTNYKKIPKKLSKPINTRKKPIPKPNNEIEEEEQIKKHKQIKKNPSPLVYTVPKQNNNKKNIKKYKENMENMNNMEYESELLQNNNDSYYAGDTSFEFI